MWRCQTRHPTLLLPLLQYSTVLLLLVLLPPPLLREPMLPRLLYQPMTKVQLPLLPPLLPLLPLPLLPPLLLPLLPPLQLSLQLPLQLLLPRPPTTQPTGCRRRRATCWKGVSR